ncbi:hypothetical protein A3K73_05005 [Candidatus Pacearchaeota archaeon RBG_13_36_9]|nr:MAG: hypothetical protein A3K73_05005 [Candidatus Pacearchaeota archaeon RBG_13_36_9]
MDKGDIERIQKEVQRAFDTHEAAAFAYVSSLADTLMDAPDKGIDLIVKTYNQALNDAYTNERGVNNRAFVQAMAGGPHEAVPWAVYNAVGTVYPYLDRKQKNRALGEILRILDTRNYAEVNGGNGVGHTTGIREPLLLSDIVIARWLYWPGLHDEEHLWKDKACFCDFQAETMDKEGMFYPTRVNSDFLVAYALLRKDFTPFGEEYAQAANPAFLERALKGIVAMRFAGAKGQSDVIKGTERLKELLPEIVHDRIEPLRQEGDWVDYKEFR